MSSIAPASNLTFTLTSPSTTRLAPRLGSLVLRRPENGTTIQVQTPGLLATTSRGVVPHLSRDHYAQCSSLRWTNVPFESFLEHNLPIPTLANTNSSHPLHTFLGFSPSSTILSVTARDPDDTREMPTNGNTHISAQTLRGVRRLSPEDWRRYTMICKPDIVVALADTPFTNPPYSQKRIGKSIERGATWLANMIKPIIGAAPVKKGKAPAKPQPPIPPHPTDSMSPAYAIFVHLAGNISPAARRAFSYSLLEPLYGPELEQIQPYKTLDEAVSGYTIDLAPLRTALQASPAEAETVLDLLPPSLTPLPATKPVVVTGTSTPHEILDLILSAGIDVFDSAWAQRAANVGVALDFTFPAPRDGEKRDLGRNIYDTQYAKDFSPLGTTPCTCASCRPVSRPERLYHGVDDASYNVEPKVCLMDKRKRGDVERAFSRAYVHHLLHTHEMSAHTLLVMHNLRVLEAFFEGVREVLGSETVDFGTEVKRFKAAYDGTFAVLADAEKMWLGVEMERGKGRLAREREREEKSGGGAEVGEP